MRSCPERAYILAFLALPPPLSDENLVMVLFAYAEIIFAHILVFPACAIEVQHISENSPTFDGCRLLNGNSVQEFQKILTSVLINIKCCVLVIL